MRAESECDRLSMLDFCDFGVKALIRGSKLEGVFDNEADVTSMDDATVVMRGPQFIATTARVDALKIQRGDAIEIEGKAYTVQRLLPDGAGMTVLALETP